MKLFNTLLIILFTLTLSSTAYSNSYNQLEGSAQSALTEPVYYTDDDDEC